MNIKKNIHSYYIYEKNDTRKACFFIVEKEVKKMGRAYTREEKEEIDCRMKDIAREMFRERGLNGVSILDITQAVGISQGGFYNFYESKEKLLLTIMIERAKEKQQVVIKRLPGSETNPREFLLNAILYFWKKLKDRQSTAEYGQWNLSCCMGK